jgi:hypothetical protein
MSIMKCPHCGHEYSLRACKHGMIPPHAFPAPLGPLRANEVATSGTHRFFIPGWRPMRLNQMIGRNKYAVSRAKKKEYEMVGAYAILAMVPRATGRRSVRLEVVLEGRQQRVDQDAYSKVVLDALVECGLLIDDDKANVAWEQPTFTRREANDGQEAGTWIVLTDL